MLDRGFSSRGWLWFTCFHQKISAFTRCPLYDMSAIDMFDCIINFNQYQLQEIHCSNYTDYLSIQANLCSQKSWKHTCPGFDPVRLLSSLLYRSFWICLEWAKSHLELVTLHKKLSTKFKKS